ncbi:MAG: methyltransferase domain-containing protein [Mariprofundaceae bacterium]|nr:methyltransferase domain-containing protein [Mariprofundaceae bacterium]
MPIQQPSTQACDLCGGNYFETVSQRDRKGHVLHTGLCLQCGLLCHQPMPSEADMLAYYRQQYRRDYHGENTPSPRRIMRAWHNGQRIADQLIPHLTTATAVFEVGAGIGCTVKSLEERGIKARGIEPNKQFNQYSRAILQAAIENCNLFDLPLKGDQDMVLLVHVIEHFTSPVRALMAIRGILGDDGLLYMECPNVTAPFATFSRLFHFAHTYNFSPETLVLLAKRCGFECIERFTDANNPDIQMLFRKQAVPEHIIPDEKQVQHVRASIHQFNTFSYHCRADYLSRRIAKLRGYWHEYRKADAFVQTLESRFRA